MITFTIMKHILILTCAITLLISCNDNTVVDTEIKVSSKNVVDPKPVNKKEQEFVNKATGSFIERYDNGNLKTEGWRNTSGQRDGKWYAYYEHGPKWSELSYINGVKEGESIVYFPNAKPHYKGHYKNDKKVGTWTFYKEDGSIEGVKEY